MSNRAFRYLLFAALALFAADCWAPPRGIRVDDASNWNLGNIGNASQCPGTSAGSTQINRFGYTFQGRGGSGYLANDYCEVAVVISGVNQALNQDTYFHFDELGLRHLFGSGAGVTGVRYSLLDDSDPFSSTGFQWGFYTFPGGTTLVGLYGLDGSVGGIGTDATSYIKQGATTVWSGTNGYDGQYFCFRNNAYIGTWNGSLSAGSSACLSALGVIFISGFDDPNE
jgi:hypothetical protein